MKAEWINPIYQAVTEVFKLMLDLNISRNGQPETAEAAVEQEVAVLIKLTGDISGAILFTFPQSTTLEIVKLMSGMEMTKLDSFVTSALGEVSNIISGNAVTHFSQANYQCDILPPQIVVKESGAAGIFENQPTLTLPLQTEAGTLKLQIALQETAQ